MRPPPRGGVRLGVGSCPPEPSRDPRRPCPLVEGTFPPLGRCTSMRDSDGFVPRGSARGCRRHRAGRALRGGYVMIAGLLAVGANVPAEAPASIAIQDSAYAPPTLTVAAGTTVQWTNRDEETHTVTSDTGLFASAGLELKESYQYTFTTRGVYPYACGLHPFMHGTIIVN